MWKYEKEKQKEGKGRKKKKEENVGNLHDAHFGDLHP